MRRTSNIFDKIYISRMTTPLHPGHIQAGYMQCVQNIIMYIIQYKIKIDNSIPINIQNT